MHRHHNLVIAALVLGAVLAACGGGGGAPATIPPTSSPAATVVTSAASSTTATTVAGSTTVATAAPATLGLSPGGPWTLVDSAPGITTPGLVYELMPKLWVYLPVQEDLANGITWTFNETDRPVIEAYLHAQLVYYRSMTTRPMDLENPEWQTYYLDGGAAAKEFLSPMNSQGQVLDLDEGIVLRPQVLGDQRTDTMAFASVRWYRAPPRESGNMVRRRH